MGRSKVLFAALFLTLTVSVVNAYTVVMRDGRRVEIPNEFNVTDSTLTYGVGNGMQVTIQLNTVDIAATEHANGETPGAFLRKANALAPVEPAPQTRRAGAERSITNNDLEKFRRARVESEKDYETRSKELGLPSMEERRREVEEIQDRTIEQVRKMRAQEEDYWRSRAEAMRAEMAARGEQLYQPIQQTPWPYPFGSYPAFWPLDSVGFGIAPGPFSRFRRSPTSPFSPFLATPITPFPTPAFQGFGRVPRFVAPGARINSRPMQIRHGSRR